MDIRDVLKNFNIERKEVEIYLAALETGTASASQIADKAGIFRTYFYDIVENLISEGLIKRSRKSKKTYFTALPPGDLVKLVEQRLHDLKKSLPQLEAIHNAENQKPKVYYYEGEKGIDEINKLTLQEKSISGFTTPKFILKKSQNTSRDYIEKRKSLGIKARIIGEMSNEILELKKRDSQELRETKILPGNIFQSEIEIVIGKNKVYITNYKDEFGLVIEDKEIANVQKNIFEMIWNSGKIVE